MARKKAINGIPTFDELIVPTLKALKELGGSGSIEEVNNKVYEIANIPEVILQIPHGEEGTTKEVDYRLAWSRTYLKKFGLLENSSRGIWALSKSDIDPLQVNPLQIVKTVKDQRKSQQLIENQTTQNGIVERD